MVKRLNDGKLIDDLMKELDSNSMMVSITKKDWVGVLERAAKLACKASDGEDIGKAKVSITHELTGASLVAYRMMQDICKHTGGTLTEEIFLTQCLEMSVIEACKRLGDIISKEID